MSDVLIGNEIASNLPAITQVYKITHDGAGNSLPYMDRSFISFTFGGKAIEEFGLIVVNGGDRMERQAYAPFSDLTSNYDTLNGQLYWGSHFEPGQLELTLATDEITDKQLDNFREWFAPGKEKELILSERPNRAIFARVAQPPTFSFLPFEKQTSITINGSSYETSTTVYRGEVMLSFIMDDPIWYAKLNYMPTYVRKNSLEAYVFEENVDVPDDVITTLSDKDMIKIMIEDGIPHQSILDKTMFLGGNILARAGAIVAPNDTENDDQTHARVDVAHLGIITLESDGLTIQPALPAYLFYSGTAPCYPIIKFSIPLEFDDTLHYISTPKNKIHNSELTEYSYLEIGTHKFAFTTPSLLTGYNQAMQVFNTLSATATQVEILEELKK